MSGYVGPTISIPFQPTHSVPKGNHSMKKSFLTIVAAFVLTMSATALVSAQCIFTTVKKTMILNGDCITDTTILVPNGITLNGAGHTITAVDPPADYFKGGVIRNRGGPPPRSHPTHTCPH